MTIDHRHPGGPGPAAVAPENQEQARSWDGQEGAYWAAHADHFDRSVSRYHRAFMASAGITAADRVLDVGCGTGQTTRDAARAASAGHVLGIDLSSEMLAVARARAGEEGLTNVEHQQGDAQVHPFEPATFDVVLSRTGAMFFGDPPAAFANLASALRPGGRLSLLAWQAVTRNEWFLAFAEALAAGRPVRTPPEGAPGPFALADPTTVRSLLAGSGFVDVDVVGKEEQMWFGDDRDAAHRFVLGLLQWMVVDLDPPTRRRAEQALRDAMAAHETPDGVLFDSATWTITATRA